MRYQFQSEHGNYSFKSQRFTNVIKALISINAALFLLRYLMVNSTTDCGMEPVSLFKDKRKTSRFLKLPISAGMGPVSWLPSKSKLVRFVNWPSDTGMVPVSWL